MLKIPQQYGTVVVYLLWFGVSLEILDNLRRSKTDYIYIQRGGELYRLFVTICKHTTSTKIVILSIYDFRELNLTKKDCKKMFSRLHENFRAQDFASKSINQINFVCFSCNVAHSLIFDINIPLGGGGGGCHFDFKFLLLQSTQI